MNSHSTSLMRLVAAMIASCTFFLLPGAAFAQQKYKYIFSLTVPGKYIEQHILDIGDVPGHQIRVAALTTKYGAEAPTYDGVKAVELSGWLMSDYINRSGKFTQYTVLQMANGDKIYQTIDGQSQTSVGADGADGAEKTSYTTITHLTGGTGKFVSIRGMLRGSGVTDFKTGPTNNPTEGEYWFDK